VELLDRRQHTQSPQHLAHVESRLAALNNRLDALAQQKSLVQRARSASQVAALYEALENRASLMAILPEVADRLTDLAQLHRGAESWGSRLADVAAQQEATDKANLMSFLVLGTLHKIFLFEPPFDDIRITFHTDFETGTGNLTTSKKFVVVFVGYKNWCTHGFGPEPHRDTVPVAKK
jgi:hypothetical protein